MNRQRGFSLIEVLVAAAIIGVAIPAMLFSVMQRLDGTAYMRERIVASWVAVNQLTQLQIENMEKGVVLDGLRNGVSEMAGARWGWSARSENTQREHHYRVEVKVWREDDIHRASLASMIGYFHDFDTLLREEGYKEDEP